MKMKVLALALAAALPAFSQPATVHLYRTGNTHAKLHVRVDGHDIFKIEANRLATFQIAPGFHEISSGFVGLGSGNAPSGHVELKAESEGEYFIHLDYEFSARRAFTGGGANSMNMMMQQEQGAPPDLKEQKLGADELAKAVSIMPVESAPQMAAQLPVSVLPEAQVEAAVVQGLHDPNPSAIGLYLSDVQTAMFSGIADNGASATSGFSVIVYSPFRWIEYQAALAHRDMRPFSVQDVTPNMRANLIRVVALPNTPGHLNGTGIAASAGVARVVICDKTRATTVQPVDQQASTVTIDSALRSKDYTSLASAFNRAEVDRVRDLDKHHEFFVVVIGDSGARKFFDVKQRYESWLN